jgi:SAM-dependent MidA family methyltransferase
MQACLYSPRGGFYSTRGNPISTHFGTSPTSHPVFGALIARQLEQMWHLLGDPPVFHVVEVGSGDGALANSVVNACWRMAPRFAQVLNYVAADYEPCWHPSPDHTFDWYDGTGDGMSPSRQDTILEIHRVKAEGVRSFRNIVGCILCNELIDNFPVHRFAIQSGRVKEVFVTLEKGNLTEVLDEPSSPLIEKRLTSLVCQLLKSIEAR